MHDRMKRSGASTVLCLMGLAFAALAPGVTQGQSTNRLRVGDGTLLGGVDSARTCVVTVIGLTSPDPTGVDSPPKRLIATGVISGEHRVISTASVVIRGATLRVIIGDGDERTARLRGVDRQSNISLLEVGGPPLKPLRRAPPQSLAVGSWVAVLANAGTTHALVTLGQVVGRGDRVDFPFAGEVIEIDAHAAPGSGGGAILNQEGEWVAIVVGRAGPGPPNASAVREHGMKDVPPDPEGILVALPVDQVDRITEDLEEYGSVRRAFLGIRLRREVDGDSLGIEVQEVVPKSPADLAGIRPGDRILAFEGDVPHSADELTWAVRSMRPGDQVDLTIARGSEIFPVHAELASAFQAEDIGPARDRTEEIRKLKSELHRLDAERAKVEEQIRTIQGGPGPRRR
jgi:S1-C subfamily serine protease